MLPVFGRGTAPQSPRSKPTKDKSPWQQNPLRLPSATVCGTGAVVVIQEPPPLRCLHTGPHPLQGASDAEREVQDARRHQHRPAHAGGGADSQTAEEAVEKLRLVDEVRRSRGVLGRVWAAWRGELGCRGHEHFAVVGRRCLTDAATGLWCAPIPRRHRRPDAGL